MAPTIRPRGSSLVRLSSERANLRIELYEVHFVRGSVNNIWCTTTVLNVQTDVKQVFYTGRFLNSAHKTSGYYFLGQKKRKTLVIW